MIIYNQLAGAFDLPPLAMSVYRSLKGNRRLCHNGDGHNSSCHVGDGYITGIAQPKLRNPLSLIAAMMALDGRHPAETV